MGDKIIAIIAFGGIFIMAGYFAWALIKMNKPMFKENSK